MKYRNLLEQIEDMTEAQLEQEVCVLVEGEWILPQVVSVVKEDYNEGEPGTGERFAKFQTILI